MTTSNSNNEASSSSSSRSFSVLALYQFVDEAIEDPSKLRDDMDRFLRRYKVRGVLLVAPEGINGTICFPTQLCDTTTTTRHPVDEASDDGCGGDVNDENDCAGGASADLENQEEKDEQMVQEMTQRQQGSSFVDLGETKQVILEWLLQKFPKLRTRVSYSPFNVFYKLRVRVKTEIITMGLPEETAHWANPVRQVGTYVEPGPDWDRLVHDPTCLVLDVRNQYETVVGSFRNALHPNTTSFTEWPAWLQEQLSTNDNDTSEGGAAAGTKYTKIAMYCTGGIRCEKASAYCMEVLKQQQQQKQQQGDEESSSSSSTPSIPPVYHLKGGILAYLDQVPDPSRSMYEGECYVFDQRVAVTHGLHPGSTWSLCRACRHPLTAEEQTRGEADGSFQQGICCPYCCNDPYREERRQRYENRQRQIELEQQYQQQQKKQQQQHSSTSNNTSQAPRKGDENDKGPTAAPATKSGRIPHLHDGKEYGVLQHGKNVV